VRFSIGDPVRVKLDDPGHHTRAPRYVRGHRGVVVEYQGDYPLPDTVVLTKGASQLRRPLYGVRFSAHELWGSGHMSTEGPFEVMVDLWEPYLEPLGGQDRS
jgi:nitrile hydratase